MKMLSEWSEVSYAAMTLFMTKFEACADADGIVHRDVILVAMTELAWCVSRFILAFSTEDMPKDKVFELMNAAIENLLQEDMQEPIEE